MQSSNFKIHSICVVKNEVDIIEYSLEQASKWSDYIYVYDNGSTDGTWEKVLSMQNKIIIPWKQDGKVFQESLRGEVFNAFQHHAQPGDWWCRLDSDEFYNIQSPRDFLSRVKPSNHVVWGIAIEYYLTHDDIDSLDFSQPVPELLKHIRYYRANNSEARFFRHRQGLTWKSDGSWPNHMGLVNKERILYKHYKYRTPCQIQKRLTTRQERRSQGFVGWDHAAMTDWHQALGNPQKLCFDSGHGSYMLDNASLPNHMEPFSRRIIKRTMHGLRVWP